MRVSTLIITKPKLLCILHYSSPPHGASKVGDFIKESKLLKDNFECRFIKIKSSYNISDIGKINIKKLYYVAELFIKVLWFLIIFRPDKIYFTANIKSVAFYRDLVLSILWKTYRRIRNCDIYYHYHIKGVDDFVSLKRINLLLTKYFVRDINLILLSRLIEEDFKRVKSYKSVFILPNGVKDSFADSLNSQYFIEKYKNIKTIEKYYGGHHYRHRNYCLFCIGLDI